MIVWSDCEKEENDMNLIECDLSVRAVNCLIRAGINTTEQLLSMTDDELIRVRNLGRRCFEEVIRFREEIHK